MVTYYYIPFDHHAALTKQTELNFYANTHSLYSIYNTDIAVIPFTLLSMRAKSNKF